MGLYRTYDITVRESDRIKADTILKKHFCDIDHIQISFEKNNSGVYTTTYRIRPYVYEDFETIKNEFKEAGIQII